MQSHSRYINSIVVCNVAIVRQTFKAYIDPVYLRESQRRIK